MSRFFASKFKALDAYTPGEQPQDRQYVKLNTNESPFPPSPKVIEALNADAVCALRLYSDPCAALLRQTMAKTFGVGAENVLVSNGSDESLNFLFLAMCERGAAFADITYGFYAVFADLYHLDSVKVPLREDFTLDLTPYYDTDKTVFLANPNAPTGLTVSTAEIEALLRANPNRLVVVDEAYVDFGGESVVPLTKRYDNLAVVGTFSKSRSLAGARLGFTIANADLIRDLETIRYSTNPYNVNRLTLLAGQAALSDGDYFRACCASIIETRAYTKAELEKRGFRLTDSKANFLFATPQRTSLDGETYYRELKSRGVLVRHFSAPRIADYVRITIGTREQMDTLLNATDEILRERG